MIAQTRTRTTTRPATAWRLASLALASLLLGLCGAFPAVADCSMTSTGQVPLTELGPAPYLDGYKGGLYPGGASALRGPHRAAALARAKTVQALDRFGNPDPEGKVVLLSIGLSNSKMEFDEFVTDAGLNPALNPHLALFNGAQGQQSAEDWLDPFAPTWNSVDRFLGDAGLTPAQVQVVWVKQALEDVTDFGPFPTHAQVLQGYLEQIVRNLVLRYPNVKLAYLSSRTRAYTDDMRANSPEPYAYESGFAIKWTIEKQMEGHPDLNFDPLRGAVVAPLLLWGPYLWIDGLVPRTDGRIWACGDLQYDYIHPAESGVDKVVDQLMSFFSADPTASLWFVKKTPIRLQPVVTLTTTPRTGPAPLTVDFSATASGSNPITDYRWAFDDGTTASGEAARKTFKVPGTYQVNLTVSDSAGNAAKARITVTVNG